MRDWANLLTEFYSASFVCLMVKILGKSEDATEKKKVCMNTFKNLGSSNPFYTLSFIVWTDKVQIIQTQQEYEKKTIYNTFPRKSSKLARLT